MRGRLVKLLAAVGATLTVLLAACSGVVEKEGNMVSNHQIPPIDMFQPARVETATFALG